MKVKETNKLILHIEDDNITLTVTRLFLEDLYNVEQAKSSEDAIKIINSKKVDLILMDIAIFGKKNGLELTKELKSSIKYSHIPIIVLTSYAFDEDRRNALNAGCDGYLSKPFHKSNLQEIIARFI